MVKRGSKLISTVVPVAVQKKLRTVDSDWAYLVAGVIATLHHFGGVIAAILFPLIMLVAHHYFMGDA